MWSLTNCLLILRPCSVEIFALNVQSFIFPEDDDDLLLWSQCTNFHRVATPRCRNNTDVTHTLAMIPVTQEDVQHSKPITNQILFVVLLRNDTGTEQWTEIQISQ